jgi:hypothetical protein
MRLGAPVTNVDSCQTAISEQKKMRLDLNNYKVQRRHNPSVSRKTMQRRDTRPMRKA